MSIPNHKILGPDGYRSGFFKSTWNIIGEDICKAILEFFEYGELPIEWNYTNLSLIPKIPNPSTTVDYRPIACCNTLYKGISKLLCSRLREILPDVVHPNQSAFIEGRLIGHNNMIYQDLIRLYHQKTFSPRCIFKIDLRKAYDSVSWEFIDHLLTKLKFPPQFYHWVLALLNTCSYTPVVNGHHYGNFQGKKGLRQGDPISPLIFVLVMDYLTRSLLYHTQYNQF